MKVIAKIESDYKSKFGIPRQSLLVEELISKIVFEPEYRDENALEGIEGFSHIWLLWEFSETKRADWSPTVRPPRLGGNKRMGVFATRSPYRPNPIGLSLVRLVAKKRDGDNGMVLLVAGADLLNGTPIYDIKPYIPYVDICQDATGGFAPERAEELKVECSEELLDKLPANKRKALLKVLAQDPRPAYHNDSERIYGLSFAGKNIRFKVEEDTVVVCGIEEEKDGEEK